jgi:hypothetical protein
MKRINVELKVYFATFQILTATNMIKTDFWDTAMCSLVEAVPDVSEALTAYVMKAMSYHPDVNTWVTF